MSKAAQSYSGGYKILHWAMALLLISMLCIGLSMVQLLSASQQLLVMLHQSFGILAAMLVVLRLLMRTRQRPQPLPSTIPNWQVRSSQLSHIGLYALMIGMPLSGYLMVSFSGRVPEFFGFITLPTWFTSDLASYGLFRSLHGWGAVLFVGLIIVHVAAALHHGLIKRDGVLKRMWR